MPPRQCPDVKTIFILPARNDLGENRQSGRDIFQVKITCTSNPDCQIEATITDNDDGQYFVEYHCPEEGEVSIDVLFKDDKNKMAPIRGSPYTASFVAGADKKNNELTGVSLSQPTGSARGPIQELEDEE